MVYGDSNQPVQLSARYLMWSVFSIGLLELTTAAFRPGVLTQGCTGCVWVVAGACKHSGCNDLRAHGKLSRWCRISGDCVGGFVGGFRASGRLILCF